MEIHPIHIWQADEFVKLHHRHNKKAGNGKFAIAAFEGAQMIGVAIAGRPRSRKLDNGKTLEVYRVCTDGTKNATSFLYARVKRIGQLMGYEKIITYTLQSESGSSLFAIGATIEKEVNHTNQWNDHGTTKRNFQAVTVMPKLRWTL